jgi:PAS domain-containing protein
MGDRNDADEEALLSPVALRDAFDAATQSEHQLRTTLDTIPTMVWSARSDGSAEFLNRRWLDYTGLPTAQALQPGVAP